MQVKTGKFSQINKQSFVKLWLDRRKYGAVSYLVSCTHTFCEIMIINLYFAKPTVKLLNHCDYAKRPADMLMLSSASFFRAKILFWFGKEIPTFFSTNTMLCPIFRFFSFFPWKKWYFVIKIVLTYCEKKMF